MEAIARAALAGWENFYVIVGSSGGALIGLQFVVIAVIRDTRTRTTSGSISAFGTPTIVHLGGALLISALMSAPWPTLVALSIAITICGIVGLAYVATVIRHTRRQTSYRPTWEDWLWHVILPGGAYATLAVAGFLVHAAVRTAFFATAAGALGLLFIAIHNAWDTVTWLVINHSGAGGKDDAPAREDGCG